MANWFDNMLGDPQGQQELAKQQLDTQLAAVAAQQATEEKIAALKYDPDRLAEQRKTYIAIGGFVLIGVGLFFLWVKYLK